MATDKPAESTNGEFRHITAGSGRSWYVSMFCLLAAVGIVALLAEHTRASTATVEVSER